MKKKTGRVENYLKKLKNTELTPEPELHRVRKRRSNWVARIRAGSVQVYNASEVQSTQYLEYLRAWLIFFCRTRTGLTWGLAQWRLLRCSGRDHWAPHHQGWRIGARMRLMWRERRRGHFFLIKFRELCVTIFSVVLIQNDRFVYDIVLLLLVFEFLTCNFWYEGGMCLKYKINKVRMLRENEVNWR